MKLKPRFILTLLAVSSFAASAIIIWILGGSNYRNVVGHVAILRRPPPIYIEPFPIPSVILGTVGGIGNQLFQYASAYALARQLNATLFVKKPPQGHRAFNPQERDFVLDYFNLDPTSFTYIEGSDPRLRIARDTVRVDEVNFFEERIPKNKIIILNDFWESEIFFKPYADELVAQYQINQTMLKMSYMYMNLSQSEIFQRIQATESVAVHFRFGDFGDDRVLPFDYQIRAMELIRQRISKEITFFVFSDDIEHVKGQMRKRNIDVALERIVFVSDASGGLTSIEEFYLMRSCKHIIAPNSSFSWWAAYLISNPNKTVIVPYPRYRQKFFDRFEGKEQTYKKLLTQKHYAYPMGWITLDPKFDDE